MTHAARMAGARVLAVDGGTHAEREDRLAGEEPLQIRAAGPDQEAVEVAVTMRTPGNEDELAVGFLFSEGLIGRDSVTATEIADPSVAARPDDTVTVRLSESLDPGRSPSAVPSRPPAAESAARRASMTWCAAATPSRRPTRDAGDDPRAAGRAAGGAGDVRGDRRPPRVRALSARRVARHGAGGRRPPQRARQGHRRALPGRGAAALGSILLVSGRISFELVQKAGAAGIPILAAVGAPTDLAVATADRIGMTVIGFVRGGRFNVYSRPDRVDLT